jgi:hypothetical protein
MAGVSSAPDRAKPPGRSHGWTRSRAVLIAVAVVIVLLAAARIALPHVLREAVNRRLERIPDYTGRVDDIDVGLWRGAYRLRGLEIVKRNGQVREPFFSARDIDFSLAWRELFRGKVVSEIYADGVRLNFVKGADADASQLAADRRWQSVINDLFPIDITLLKITDGELRFVNTASTPRVDVRVAHAIVLATGLRNGPSNPGETFPAFIAAEGDSIGGGKLKIVVHAEPLAAQPHFYLKLQLEDVSLPALNDFLRAYGGVDVSAGKFKAYVEVAASGGRYKGYFKPFFEHIDFTDLPGEHKPLHLEIWEGLVRIVAKIFRNSSRDSVATQIPFSGEIGRLDTGSWETFVNLMRHAFVRALPEKLDSSVKPNSGEIMRPIPPKEKAPAPPGTGKH